MAHGKSAVYYKSFLFCKTYSDTVKRDQSAPTAGRKTLCFIFYTSQFLYMCILDSQWKIYSYILYLSLLSCLISDCNDRKKYYYLLNVWLCRSKLKPLFFSSQNNCRYFIYTRWIIFVSKFKRSLSSYSQHESLYLF